MGRGCVPCACGKPVPCLQNPPCSNLVGSSAPLPNLGTVAITGPDKLLAKLLHEGGAIVNANICTAHEVAQARCDGRLYLDPAGYGFVLRTREWLEEQNPEPNCCCPQT